MAKLGNFFTIASGGTPDKRNPSYYENGTIPWVKTGDLKNQYVPAGIECITEEGLNNSSAKLFPPNTVLVAMYGATIGACSILTYEAATNQACAAFLPNENVLPTYLYYFLSSKRDQFVKDGVGGAQPNISAGYLKNVQFDLVPVRQQEVIVERLDKIENLIALRKEQLAKLDQLVKSRFIELFGDPTDNPNNYPMKRIDEVAELVKGITYSPEEVCDKNGIVVLRSSNIKGSTFDLQDIVTVSKKISAEKLVKEHDILMCNRNGSARLVGKVALIPRLEEDMRFGTFMTIVRSEMYKYLFVFFQMDAFRRQIQFQTAVAINQISLPLLAGVTVPVPPMELQEQFTTFVEQTDKSKLAIQQSLDKLELLKKSLMQKYFG